MLVGTAKEKSSNFMRYIGDVSSVAMFTLTGIEHYKLKPVWSFRER